VGGLTVVLQPRSGLVVGSTVVPHAQSVFRVGSAVAINAQSVFFDGWTAMITSLTRVFLAVQPCRKLAALKGSNGYKNVAHDLQALSSEMENIWSQIEGKCATSEDDLKAASQMATRLTRIVGLRDQAPAVLAGLTEERMRAFTTMMKVYDEARSAVGYLRRHEGDVDSIAPLLYTGKSTRRKATEPDPTAPPEAAAGGPPHPGSPVAGGTGPLAGGATVPTPPPQDGGRSIANGGVAARGPFVS
jgi:hypothetical protein